jgi:hypothetical protein
MYFRIKNTLKNNHNHPLKYFIAMNSKTRALGILYIYIYKVFDN